MENNIAIDIFDKNIIKYGENILNILLKDRTTGKNIIWATDDYNKLGNFYNAKNEIIIENIIAKDEKFIRPRVLKSYEKQSNRTRDKAEVFTPSWVCNLQNNLVDDAWFGKKNLFNETNEKIWKATSFFIQFSGEKGKTWKDYIDARRMEITCGEAPYLVSRYDTVTGKEILLNERIGLLDRKMRVVNENTNNEEDWFKWAERAFQSIYGYEFQGDNLLLARENLLFTFIDNVKSKFNREPTTIELKKIAVIISWNIWQMDGLKYTIPLHEEIMKNKQLSLFDNKKNQKKNEPIYCKIKNWRSDLIIEYRSILEG